MGALDQFLCILYWGTQLTFFTYYMEAPPISFFSYNMRAPLRSVSYILLTIYSPPPLRSVSLHAIGGPPQISFFTKYMGAPSDQFLKLTIWGPPHVSFFAYYIWGPLRSVSVHTIWGPLSDQCFLLLYGAPSDQCFCILYGAS